MSEYPYPKQLPREQLALLSAIYQGFRERGDWPTFHYIDKALDQQGLDTNKVAATLPSGLTNLSVRPLNPADEANLSVAGLSYLPEATYDVDVFMKVLWYAIERERDYPLTPDGSQGPSVSSEELQGRLRLTPEEVARVERLIRWEPWIGSGKGSAAGWEYWVNREIRRYRGVQTVQDYMRRRYDALETVFGRGSSVSPVADLPSLATENYGPQQAANAAARKAFVIMPFRPTLEPVYAMIRESCLSLGVEVKRADEIAQAGRITEQIYEALGGADVIIADITGLNPNVMYELGYGHALKKAVILINSGKRAPFDIADYRQLRYRLDDLGAAKGSLLGYLRNTLRLD